MDPGRLKAREVVLGDATGEAPVAGGSGSADVAGDGDDGVAGIVGVVASVGYDAEEPLKVFILSSTIPKGDFKIVTRSGNDSDTTIFY